MTDIPVISLVYKRKLVNHHGIMAIFTQLTIMLTLRTKLETCKIIPLVASVNWRPFFPSSNQDVQIHISERKCYYVVAAACNKYAMFQLCITGYNDIKQHLSSVTGIFFQPCMCNQLLHEVALKPKQIYTSNCNYEFGGFT